MSLKLQVKKIIEQTKLKQTEKELREIINNNFLLKMIPYKFAKIINIQEIYKACIDDINKFNSNLDQVQKNQFIQTCDEDQLSLYEGILKLNNSKLPIEVRRSQILAIFSNILPFTLVSLMEKLNNVAGFKNWKLHIYYDQYLIKVEILYAQNSYIETVLLNFIIPMLPAHIAWHLYRQVNVNKLGTIYATGCVYRRDHITISQEE